MILSEVTFIRKNEILEQMLQEVTSIYNKTLYFLRQSYFKKLKFKEKILNADINGAIGMMRKVKAISDAQLMNLRDRGDVVSQKINQGRCCVFSLAVVDLIIR